MKALTLIDKKTKNGEALAKDDIIFLYEINSKIQGFGYRDDPRIKELRDKRRSNIKEDAATVFECQPDQIAWKMEDINQNTKAYVGKLEPGIFDLIQKHNIEHIYTSFPEGKISRETIEIGGRDFSAFFKELDDAGIKLNFENWKNVQGALPAISRAAKFGAKKISKEAIRFFEELVDKQINISSYAQDILQSKDFTILKKSESADLIRLKVSDLGFGRGATTDEIYKKAGELGLELCPAEVGPHYILKYKDQPLGEWFSIAMKQIDDRDRRRDPDVFDLGRSGGGLWLHSGPWAKPTDWWGSGDRFVFRLRKLKS